MNKKKILIIAGAAVLTAAVVISAALMLNRKPTEKEEAQSSGVIPQTVETVAQEQEAGLSDPWNIGVDKEKLNIEELYPIPQDIKHVVKAIDYGVTPDDGYDDTKELNKVLAEVSKYKGELVQVLLPTGQLDFIEGMNNNNTGVSIGFEGLENVVFSGENTTLMFHGATDALELKNCENIYMNGINIDWGRTPFSMGTITKNDGQTFEVTVAEGYPVDENVIIAGFLEYDQKTNAPRVNGNDIYGDVKSVQYLGNQKLIIQFNSQHEKSPEGTKVILRHQLYENDAISVLNSNNLHFENVTIYTAPGMGFLARSSDNLYFNRFNVMLKPDTDRLMSTTADGIHLMDCGGEVKVTNSIFENCGDDALNAHGAYLVIENISKDGVITAKNPRGYNFKPKVGDTVELSMVTTLLPVIDAKVIDIKDSTTDQGFVLTLDKAIPDTIQKGDVIANATRTPQLEYRNNLVRNKRCRGILVQTRNAVIENNTFANLGNGGVLVTTDAGAWFESLGSHNVVIKNNKFVGNNTSKTKTPGDISAIALAKNDIYGPAGVFKNIIIENNFIANTCNAGIFINSTSGAQIKNNLISAPGISPQGKYYNAGIGLSYSDNITLEKNMVVPNNSSDFKGLSLGAVVDVETLAVKANSGIDTSAIDSIKVATTEVKQIQDNVIRVGDKSLSDWTGVGTDIGVYGVSDADQNEVTLEDSNFKLNMAKMTWDKNNLYIGFDVSDNQLIWVGEKYWLGDGVELFFTANTDSSQPMETIKYNDESCLELFMGSGAAVNTLVETRTSSVILKNKDGINMSLWEKADGKGYSGEAKISLASIPAIREAIEQDKEIKFTLRVADTDKDKLQIQISNAPHPVEFNKFVPARMPSVKFVK